METHHSKPTDLKLDMVTIDSIMSPTEESINMFTLQIKKEDEKVEEIVTPGQVSDNIKYFFMIFFYCPKL